MMDCSAVAAELRPASPTTSSSAITSLTTSSNAKSAKHQSSGGNTRRGGGITLAEALATSVADFVCDRKQRLINGVASATNSATTMTTMTKTTTMTTATTTETAAAGGADSTSTTRDEIRPVGGGCAGTMRDDDSASSRGKIANRSSMSTAVADLASGMDVFGGGDDGARGGGTRSSSSSSGKGEDHHQRPRPRGAAGGGIVHMNNCAGSASAPMVSGTAAAVLALQNASCNNASIYDNIVSSSNIISSSSSSSSLSLDIIDGRKTTMITTSASSAVVVAGRRSAVPMTGSAGRVVVASSVDDAAALASDNESSSPDRSRTSSRVFHLRHSDGAPIIAGTAAAAYFATAAAAHITCATTRDVDAVGRGGGTTTTTTGNGDGPRGGNESSCRLNDDGGGGVVVGSDRHRRVGVGDVRAGDGHRRHGFSSSSSSGEGGESGAAATAAKVTKQGSSALSWADHCSDAARILPESGPSATGACSSDHSSAHQAPWVTPSLTTSGRAGGMYILAEITCHAPPLPLSSNLSRPSFATGPTTAAASSNIDAYYSQQNYGIPSHQEIHYQAKSSSSSQEQYSQPHQPLEDVPRESPTPENAKRVLAIPTYQEIYREMGISPEDRHHHPSQSNHSTFNYSVEEVPVDSYHLSSHPSESFHAHAIHHQYDDPPSSAIDDPTRLSTSNQFQSNSRTPTAHFGHVNREDVEEGKELYTRKDLCRFGGHISEAKDFHGNMKDGCDSLVVGNMEKDLRECDGLLWFLLSTDRANGGGALCQSYHKKRPIRIFRSSLLGGKYAPPFLDVEDDIEEDSDVAYRYDGLYMVRAVWDIQGQETECHPVSGENGWQTFFFTRLPKKPLEKGKWEDGMEYNAMGCQELWSTIQKMRGVRKPKKFEIPPPPTKLGPLKKCAISGASKDRKAAGLIKPVGDIDVVASIRPPPQSKSPITSSTQNPRRKTNLQEHDESSEEENHIPDAGCDDESDSDMLDQQQQHHTSHLSAPTPFKVITHRPRLNSTLHSDKASPSAHNDDAASSDSESFSSESHLTSKQNKRRKHSPTQKNSNDNDAAAFIPKRATAAKAEAANRDMFGGSKSQKRKSSETATSETGSKLLMRNGAGRKRTRIRYHDENDFSSSEKRQAQYVVDQSIITIGSRVLVAYKGALYKATIRKRREKAGRHDFLIHYDGNKKSNVHWIPVDDINKILEVNVDTPPKKNTSTASAGVGGATQKKENNSVAKRKGLLKQDSLESNHSEGVKDQGVPTEESNIDDYQESESPPNSIPVEVRDIGMSEREVYKLNDDSSGNEEIESASGDIDEELAPKDISEPVFCNSELIITSSVAASIMPRKTVVSDVCRAEPLKCSEKEKSFVSMNHNDTEIIPADKAESDSNDDGSGSESDENSTALSDKAKQEQYANQPIAELKYPVGGHVYVEYRQIFYSSTILKTRRKRGTNEYLVHYEGYKKSSNTWVKENSLHEVNALTTKRFEEQRVVPADNLNESEQPSELSTASRKKKVLVIDTLSSDSCSNFANQKKPPTPKLRSDASDAVLDALESGVAFLAGSMVFVEWSGALFLAKMLKKRYAGDRMEYLISYDGFSSNHDTWLSIRKIYEVNPQTKRVFKKLNLEMSVDGKRKQTAPPCHEQRETRKMAKDDDGAIRGSGKNSQPTSRSLSRAAVQLGRTISSLSGDMQSIESGVEFLPGSTLFAEYKGGLCLAKMLKKRGKGDYMEYFVQYNGLKKTEEAWVSTALVYEINPQTKRMFRQLSLTK